MSGRKETGEDKGELSKKKKNQRIYGEYCHGTYAEEVCPIGMDRLGNAERTKESTNQRCKCSKIILKKQLSYKTIFPTPQYFARAGIALAGETRKSTATKGKGDEDGGKKKRRRRRRKAVSNFIYATFPSAPLPPSFPRQKVREGGTPGPTYTFRSAFFPIPQSPFGSHRQRLC